jgi:hypothetical protein
MPEPPFPTDFLPEQIPAETAAPPIPSVKPHTSAPESGRAVENEPQHPKKDQPIAAPAQEPPKVMPAIETPIPQGKEAFLPPPYPDLDEADAEDLWTDVLKFVKETTIARLGTFDVRALEACLVTEMSNKSITITYPRGAEATLLPLSLKERIAEFLKRSVEVVLVESGEAHLEESHESRRMERREQRRQEIDKELREHPQTQKMLDLFQGSVTRTDVSDDALEEDD